jgi:hypothetical protein
MSNEVVLHAHAAATWFLVGLIWTIQIVHYPLFARVGDGFATYERDHSQRITLVLALPWSLEAITAMWLVVFTPSGVPVWLPVAGVVLLAATVVSTIVMQRPLHRRLGGGFDAAAHRRLVASNWLRVAAWSLRGVVAAAMLALADGG